MSNLSNSDFEHLLSACNEIAEMFPDGAVFIGGIAVYLHAINCATARDLAEFTHDADFYISIADMGDLRDMEEVTPNRRLSKHQLIKGGFEFDIYTERQSALPVPYDAVAAHARNYGTLKVAALEELFVLKLGAFRDRCASAKGEKDAKDLVRITAVAASRSMAFDGARVAPYLGTDDLTLLRRVGRSAAFMSMAKGNAVLAKRLRDDYAAVVSNLARRLQGPGDDSDHRASLDRKHKGSGH